MLFTLAFLLVAGIEGADSLIHEHERVLRSAPGTMLVKLDTPCSEIAADAVSALEASAMAAIAGFGIEAVDESTTDISANCDGHLDFSGDMRIATLTITLSSGAGEAGAAAAASALTAGVDGTGPIALGDGYAVVRVLIFVDGMVRAYPDWGDAGVLAREAGSNDNTVPGGNVKQGKVKKAKKSKKDKGKKGDSKLPKMHGRSDELFQRQAGFFQRHTSAQEFTAEQWCIFAFALVGSVAIVVGAATRAARVYALHSAGGSGGQGGTPGQSENAVLKESSNTTGAKLSPVRNRAGRQYQVMQPQSVLELDDKGSAVAAAQRMLQLAQEKQPLIKSPAPVLA